MAIEFSEFSIERKISDSLSDCESDFKYSQYKNKYFQIFRIVQSYLPDHIILQMYELDEYSNLIIEHCAGLAYRDGFSNGFILGNNTKNAKIT
jgi:hypothetical protein